jgi:hypothetical protein
MDVDVRGYQYSKTLADKKRENYYIFLWIVDL